MSSPSNRSHFTLPSDDVYLEELIVKHQLVSFEFMMSLTDRQLKSQRPLFEVVSHVLDWITPEEHAYIVHLVSEIHPRPVRGDLLMQDTDQATLDPPEARRVGMLDPYVQRWLNENKMSEAIGSQRISRAPAEEAQWDRTSQHAQFLDMGTVVRGRTISGHHHLRTERQSVRDAQEPSMPSPVLKSRDAQSRYHVLEALGKGGTSDVWLVHDQHLGRKVALKLLRPSLPTMEERLQLESFEIEARVMSQLDHPGILPVFDFLDSEDVDRDVEGMVGHKTSSIGGYTMRVASYQSLSHHIDHNKLSLHELCDILKQVALTVEHAHKRGIIHRDLKPHNILLGDEGEVYLTDWGVCLLTEEHEDAHLMSDELRALLVGSPHFMAPEQTSSASKIDHRVDVYGLGATLYYGLTRQPPVNGYTLHQVLYAARHGHIIPPERFEDSADHTSSDHSGLPGGYSEDTYVDSTARRETGHSTSRPPGELSKICMRALKKRPSDRFQSARQFAEALERFLSGELERERRVELCTEAFNRGNWSKVRFEKIFHIQQEMSEKIREIKSRMSVASTPELKSELWSTEEKLETVTAPLEESFSKAVSAYREALSQDPHHTQSTQALVHLFWTRYEEAERRGDQDWMIYFEGQLREFAEPKNLEMLDGMSRISLPHLPDHAKIRVSTVQLNKYRTIETLYCERSTPLIEPLELPRGNFLITITHPETIEVKVPLEIKRAHIDTLQVRLPRRDAIPEGFTYIKDKWCLQTYPVTVQEYFQFLNSLDQECSAARAPRYYHTAYASPNEEGKYEAPFIDVEGDEWAPDWPVMLVSQRDAMAYAEWLAQELDKSIRLPTAEEWMSAAQGADQRPYPWGRAFDASLCSMRETQPGRPLPTRVGAYSSDRSPYGVYDMAGTIAQWTNSLCVGTDNYFRVMGAAFNSMSLLCELNQEIRARSTECMIHIGFRVALELDEDDFYQQ